MAQPHKPVGVLEPLLNGPICPHCRVHTALSVIAPEEPGVDRCTFRCALCGHEETVVEKINQGLLIRFK